QRSIARNFLAKKLRGEKSILHRFLFSTAYTLHLTSNSPRLPRVLAEHHYFPARSILRTSLSRCARARAAMPPGQNRRRHQNKLWGSMIPAAGPRLIEKLPRDEKPRVISFLRWKSVTCTSRQVTIL